MRADGDLLKAKSVHIFAWPFRFEMDHNTDLKAKVLEKGWIRKNMDFMNVDNNEQRPIDYFMLHQYLSQSARDIFISGETDICCIYQYPLTTGKKYQYSIKKGNEEYCLPIAEIELHVYDYGVGILFIQVWNSGYDISLIKKINDYGRRISVPYLAEGGLLCADHLGILISDGSDKITDFKRMVDNYINNNDLSDARKLLKPAEFLDDILNCNLDDNNVKDIEVIPLTDDRMFVISLIRDDLLSEDIKNYQEDSYDDSQLYSIIFVDPDSATCQNKEMRKRLLEDAVYPRWSDWGTLYGVTSYSFCCITTDSEVINESVVRPFLIEYSYLVSLVLAQRVGIMAFTAQAGEIIEKISYKRGIRQTREIISHGKKLSTWVSGITKSIKRKAIGTWQTVNLSQVQKRYIDLKNRLFILEASNQEQGIELYQMLQKQMLVKDEQDMLDEKLQSLYDAENINIGNRIAVIGIVLAAAALFPNFGYDLIDFGVKIVLLIVLVVGMILL